MAHDLVIPDLVDAPTIGRSSGKDVTIYTPAISNDLPAFTGSQSATVDNVTVVLTFENSKGVISSNTSPGGTSKVWDSSARTFTVIGTMANVNLVIADLQYTSVTDEQVDIPYEIQITDDDGKTTKECSGGDLKLVPDTLLKDYIKACTGDLDLTGTNGSIRLRVVNAATNEIIATISDVIPFNTNLSTTTSDLLSNIAGLTTTPQFEGITISGDTFQICAPQGLGQEANKYVVVIEVTGDMGLSGNKAFEGGQTGTDLGDLFKQAGLAAERYGLVDIAAQLADAALAAILNPGVAQIRIDIPAGLEPILQVRVKWQGRNVILTSDDYDPVLKTYGGGWDLVTFGTPTFTNNPAWCLLDFIKNDVFGVEKEIYGRMTTDQRTIFHNDIYEAAQRCDEIVGTTNRYTLNALVTNKRSNIDIINDIAGVMHAKVLFLPSNVIRLAQDKPRDPVLLVNQSGVGQEGFSYGTKSPKTIYNRVLVSYYDPERYAQLVTIEEDFVSITTVRDSSTLNILAWGVDNTEQAIRHSRKVIFDENTTIVTAKYLGTLDHQNIIPGQIVRILDEWNETVTNAFGGRVTGSSGLDNIVSDRDLVISGNPSIYITMPDATFHTTTIASVSGTGDRSITLTDDMPDTPIVNAKFNITDGVDYIVTKVSRNAKGIYEIFGIPYQPDKYAAIDA